MVIRGVINPIERYEHLIKIPKIGKVTANKILDTTDNYEELVKQIFLEKSNLEDYELHNLLISMGEYRDYTDYLWALQRFDIQNAEPSEYMQQFMNNNK